MELTLSRDDSFAIGAFTFPDRKKPCIGVRNGNEVVCYGSFHNESDAREFMKILANFIGAITPEVEQHDSERQQIDTSSMS